MARVIYSEAALGDLERIIDFALNASPATAAGTFERIRTAIDILSSHPLIGRRIDADIRKLIISQGATVYIAVGLAALVGTWTYGLLRPHLPH